MATKIVSNYLELSDQQKRAADFVLSNPVEVATRSVRAIAENTGIPAPTFSRMARTLGYGHFDELREECRLQTSRVHGSIYARASMLQAHESKNTDGTPFFYRQAAASIENIQRTIQDVPLETINEAVSTLRNASQIFLYGALSSSGFVDYLGYLGSWINDNWKVLREQDSSLGSELASVKSTDVLVLISVAPYAAHTKDIARAAHKQGAKVIAITDDVTAPFLKYSDIGFRLPIDSPQFFSSYAAITVVLETLIGMLAAQGGEKTRSRISMIEDINCQIGKYQLDNEKSQNNLGEQ